MIRIFIFLLLVLLLGFGFSWFADRPGEVVMQWQGNQYETSLMVVLALLVALVAAIMILWWLARTVLDSPRIMRRFFRARKRDRGYQALSKGLIAANSGDALNARRYTKESLKLLGNDPLVGLLDAQSALLEGKRDEARGRFEAMLDDDRTRLVGLRGLYLEAERQGAGEAARHYARQAHETAPSLNWAGAAKLRYSAMDGDWEGALATLEANRAAGLVEKDAAKRQRAVLLTALAMSVEPADPVRAAKLAREAHKLQPELVPAAIIGAKALARNSDIGRAAGMLETVWKKQPHPEIGQSYIHLRMGDSPSDRLKRAKKLAAMKENNPEGSYLIAEAAIEAKDWKLARAAMVPILNSAPSERACLIMADIEEGQSGDQGRMRDWLSRAVRAPKDAAWTADGYVSDQWLPISPVSGKIDAFEWKVPIEQLGGPGAHVLEADGLQDLIREPDTAPIISPVSASDKKAGSTRGEKDNSDGKMPAAGGLVASEVIRPSAGIDKELTVDVIDGFAVGTNVRSDTSRVKGAVEVASVGVVDEVGTGEKSEESEGPASSKATGIASANATGAILEEKSHPVPTELEMADASHHVKTSTVETTVKAAGIKKDIKDVEEEILFPLERRPDDPGVREGDGPQKPKRFGLF